MTTPAGSDSTSSSSSSSLYNVKFVPFVSSVEIPFWVRYSQLKLETIKLDETPLELVGYFDATTNTNSSSGTAGNSNRLQIHEMSLKLVESTGDDADKSGAEAVDPAADPGTTTISSSSTNNNVNDRTVSMKGTLRGYNTMESFSKVDKNLLLKQIWQSSLDDEDKPPQTFVLLTFADLKKHSMVYWFGFPAPMCKESISSKPKVFEGGETVQDEMWTHFIKILYDYRNGPNDSKDSTTSSPKSIPSFFASTKSKLVPLTTNYLQDLSQTEYDSSRIIFGFIDPAQSSVSPSSSSSNSAPFGWPLRNLLAFLSIKCKLGGKTCSIMSLRIPIQVLTADLNKNSSNEEDQQQYWMKQANTISQHSQIWDITIPSPESYNYSPTTTDDDNVVYKVVGWELNQRQKPGPRSVNLRPLLDQNHLAVQAADLNLKLMKWRMIPSLQVDRLQSMKVLLLGAGTLGCSVARTLLGWGVRDFTFVDYGNVSYSNPVRQNLFTLDDCHYQHGGGRPKAEAAANALKTIAADVTSKGVRLSIPMPGHADQPPETLEESVLALDGLVQSCDVVFLLTDTRESRWLPTVMAAAHDKIMINAALGLDSWLVMRHGGGLLEENEAETGSSPSYARLGCYFCNDVVAPENSTKNRTLDQQCTVTRPGLAPIASSMAAELMVSLLHHPKQQLAPAPKQTSTDYSPTGSAGGGHTEDTNASSSSPLGIIPHQIRGSIVSYTMMNPTVPAFKCCTGCSRPVVEAYKLDKLRLVSEACASVDGSFLEDLSGLTAFRAEAADKLAEMEVDWDIDDDEEGEEMM